MPYVDTRHGTEDRPIGIVDHPCGGSARWQFMTLQEAKHLAIMLRAAIDECESTPATPRPEPEHDSGTWSQRRKWFLMRWKMYESGRS